MAFARCLGWALLNQIFTSKHDQDSASSCLSFSGFGDDSLVDRLVGLGSACRNRRKEGAYAPLVSLVSLSAVLLAALAG